MPMLRMFFFEKLPGSTKAASAVAVVEESFGRSRSTSRLTKLCRGRVEAVETNGDDAQVKGFLPQLY